MKLEEMTFYTFAGENDITIIEIKMDFIINKDNIPSWILKDIYETPEECIKRELKGLDKEEIECYIKSNLKYKNLFNKLLDNSKNNC